MKMNEQKKTQQGFTLIEMVVVLAVIGVLAAVVAPRGLKVYNDARIQTVVTAAKALETADIQYAMKNFTMPASEAALLTSGFLDGFPSQTIKVGNPILVTVKVHAGNIAGAGGTPTGFDLDGDGAVDTVATETLMELNIKNTSTEDAAAIDLAIDGSTMSSGVGVADAKGRVEYSGTATTTVHVYITRQ